HSTRDEKIFICNQCIGPRRMATVPDGCYYFASDNDAQVFASEHCNCPRRPPPVYPEKRPEGQFH
ncbi:MAG: hypothetical protein V2B18_20645, partial [Pseudomonadota bacterium]